MIYDPVTSLFFSTELDKMLNAWLQMYLCPDVSASDGTHIEHFSYHTTPALLLTPGLNVPCPNAGIA